MKPALFYEDMHPGQKVVGPSIVVDRSEMIAFATTWDPLPFHVDEDAARAVGGLTAPGIYILALKQRLVHQLSEQHAVIASLGYDEVRFHAPVRPGDALTLGLEWLDRRPSRSRDDRGVVTVRFSLIKQDGTLVMSHSDTILVRRRTRAEEPTTHRAANPSGAAFHHQRVLPHPPERVFEAFARPDVLARWWGPVGFTNTFERFEFAAGGRWQFVMHGPDGASYPNESVFLEVAAPSTLVIQHVSPPRFVLTVVLTGQEGGTAIRWVQEFEDAAVAARMRHLVEPANEQNLDRLQSVLSYDAEPIE
jgi:acyl dehydratase/uncharacterized protein YndB with AHSA1/START domain